MFKHSGTPRTRPEVRGSPPHGVRLLEADLDLASELTDIELQEARRQVIVPALSVARGPWQVGQLGETRGVTGNVRGFLVLDGTVGVELSIAGQTCIRLLTPGELVLLDGWQDSSIPVQTGWTAFEPANLAILDRRLTVIATRWPGLMDAILKRAAQQIRHALLQQAINQLPRVEDRLLALLWSIADRQGIVRGDGVWVHLPVTHATLAQMIGARRPTVSLGLRSLTEHGAIITHDTGWILAPESADSFPHLEPQRRGQHEARSGDDTTAAEDRPQSA